MLGVLYATEKEARPLLDRLRAEPLAGRPSNAHRARVGVEELVICITGMGPNAAAEGCRSLIENHAVDAIVNIGICGALSDAFTVGDLVAPVTTQFLDAETSSSVSLSTWPKLRTGRLGTVTDPLFDTAQRNQFASHSDLVDMEGAAIARVCAEHSVPCYMLKGVSDSAGDGDREHLRRHLESVARTLADHFCRDAEQLLASKPRLVEKLMNFTRIEHTIFSLPLLFAGAWLGAGGRVPRLLALSLIAVVGVGARAFGMAMNRILDRDIDAKNPRTANRELPSGRLSLFGAYSVAVAGLVAYFAGCAALGRTCLYLSPVPLLPLATYALLKRFTPLCHFGIGICLGAAPLGAYVATSDQLPLAPDVLLLGAFALLWISGFDIIYALQDAESDRVNGVKSIPAAWGSLGAQVVAALTHLAAVIALVILWREIEGGYFSALAIIVSMLAFSAAYHPRVPLPVRFFPLSAVAGVAGACVVLFENLP